MRPPAGDEIYSHVFDAAVLDKPGCNCEVINMSFWAKIQRKEIKSADSMNGFYVMGAG
jgi:hypothetical protein